MVEALNSDPFDHVFSTVSFSLASHTYIENLTLVGTNNANATGNSGDNGIVGNSGDNILDGGGGKDQLVGGAGNDTYIIDGKEDVVTEYLNGGIDTIFANFTIFLDTVYTNFENATLTGNEDFRQVTGNAGANVLTGGGGDDNIVGFGGDDKLIGGVGYDHLNGGDGDDYIVGGEDSDHITLGAGHDTVDINAWSELFDSISGFTFGAGGDVIDLSDLLDDLGYTGSDPFADGYLRFSGSYLDVDPDGAGTNDPWYHAISFGDTSGVTSDNYII